MSHSSVEIVRVVWRRLLVVCHCFCKRKGGREGRGREEGREGEREGERKWNEWRERERK